MFIAASPSSTGGAEISEYELCISEGTESDKQPSSPVYKGSKTEYACTALSPGTTYLLQVRAINCAGWYTLSIYIEALYKV